MSNQNKIDTRFLEDLQAFMESCLPDEEFSDLPSEARFPLLPGKGFTCSRDWLMDASGRLRQLFSIYFPDVSLPDLSDQELFLMSDAVLNLDGKIIWMAAQRYQVSPEFLTLFLIYLHRPYRRKAAQVYGKKLAVFDKKGTYCPLCGTAPALILTGSDTRVWCCHCGCFRPFPDRTCPSCTYDEPEYRTVQQVQLLRCRICKRFFKVFLEEDRDRMDLRFVNTSTIDRIMFQEGWIKEFPILPAINLTQIHTLS